MTWQITESKQTLSAWQTELKTSFKLIEPYLMATKYDAEVLPCPNGCFRSVVKLDDDSIFAICTLEEKDCRNIELQKDDIKLYKIDIVKFTAKLQQQLDNQTIQFITPKLCCELSSTYHIANYNNGQELPIKLSLMPLNISLEMATIWLKLSDKGYFILTLGELSTRLKPLLPTAVNYYNISSIIFNEHTHTLS